MLLNDLTGFRMFDKYLISHFYNNFFKSIQAQEASDYENERRKN
jgi:hypothetical protein